MAASGCVGLMVWNLMLFHLASSVDAGSTIQESWTWFFSNRMYYMLYDYETTLDKARCNCNSLPAARLAAFDHSDVAVDDVYDYLTLYYPNDSFWLDAERNGIDFIWRLSRCPLPTGTSSWAFNEPEGDDYEVDLMRGEYYGTKLVSSNTNVTNRPLCQSVSAPPNYLPTPPVLTWVKLGKTGHMFGFSNDPLALDDARKACSHQAGQVRIATLETLYDEVAQYILDNHPERNYWLDAVRGSVGSPINLLDFHWPVGGGISISPNQLEFPTLDSVIMFESNGYMKLTAGPGFVKHYYICRGYPAPEPNTINPSPPPLNWVSLGSPPNSKKFWFSTDMKNFIDAAEACAAQPGSVRLAVLDTMKSDVINYMDRNMPSSATDFYIGASRPEGSSSADFFWMDGKPLEGWNSYPSDCAATLTKGQTFAMTPTSDCHVEKQYICEQIPDVTLEWRSLGSSPKLFGFSRTRSWGVEWARHACSSQLGDVKLADLDTHFDDVSGVIAKVYPGQEFWVDASPDPATTFRWSNGISVMHHMWLSNGTPYHGHKAARIKSEVGGDTLLSASITTTDNFYFVCEGQPATPVIRSGFGPPCTVTTVRPSSAAATLTTTSTSTKPTFSPTTYPNPNPTLQPACVPAVTYNVSEEELAAKILDIRNDLLLNPRDLSATKRKMASAKDQRKSALLLGTLGLILLLGPPLGFIVIGDIASPIVHIVKKILGVKRVDPTEMSTDSDIQDTSDDCAQGTSAV